MTGGGRGLGRAFARALAAAGAHVAVTARTATQVDETVKMIERAGGRALAIPGDVSAPDAVAHVVTTTVQQLGPVDLLVNNAGWHVPGSLGYAWEVDPEGWWHTLKINLRGPFLCARAVLPGMIQRHRGRIVNISSGTAVNANPFMDALCTSKAALTHWTRCLAMGTRALRSRLRLHQFEARFGSRSWTLTLLVAPGDVFRSCLGGEGIAPRFNPAVVPRDGVAARASRFGCHAPEMDPGLSNTIMEHLIGANRAPLAIARAPLFRSTNNVQLPPFADDWHTSPRVLWHVAGCCPTPLTPCAACEALVSAPKRPAAVASAGKTCIPRSL